jgi:hypothetical protein
VRVLESIERAHGCKFGLGPQLRPSERVGGENEQIGVPAVAMAEGQVAGSWRGLP